MKKLCAIVFCALVLLTTANAQTTTPLAPPLLVKLTHANWKDNRDPWYSHCDECSGGVPEVTSRHFSSELAKRRAKYEAKQPRYTATAVLKNKSAQAVKSVAVEFVFMDIPTRRELVRYLMRTDVALRPGQKKKIEQKIFDNDVDDTRFKPLRGESVLQTGQQTRVRVFVARVEYADGSVWEQP